MVYFFLCPNQAELYFNLQDFDRDEVREHGKTTLSQGSTDEMEAFALLLCSHCCYLACSAKKILSTTRRF